MFALISPRCCVSHSELHKACLFPWFSISGPLSESESGDGRVGEEGSTENNWAFLDEMLLFRVGNQAGLEPVFEPHLRGLSQPALANSWDNTGHDNGRSL